MVEILAVILAETLIQSNLRETMIKNWTRVIMHGSRPPSHTCLALRFFPNKAVVTGGEGILILSLSPRLWSHIIPITLFLFLKVPRLCRPSFNQINFLKEKAFALTRPLIVPRRHCQSLPQSRPFAPLCALNQEKVSPSP